MRDGTPLVESECVLACGRRSVRAESGARATCSVQAGSAEQRVDRAGACATGARFPQRVRTGDEGRRPTSSASAASVAA